MPVTFRVDLTRKYQWSILKKKELYFLPIYSRSPDVLPPTSIQTRQRRRGDCHVRSKMPGFSLLAAVAWTTWPMKSSSKSTENDSSWDSGETYGSGMTVLQLFSDVKFEVFPTQLNTIAGFVGTGQWLGHPRHRTSHHCTSSYGATWEPWLTNRQLNLKRILKQQQAPGRYLALLIVRDDLCFVIIGFVLRLVAVRRSICSKLARNSSFRILQSFCLISTLSLTHFDGHLYCQDARPTYSCLTILSFSHFFHLKKFGHGVFPHSIQGVTGGTDQTSGGCSLC